MLEDTKGVPRSRKLKERLYHGQKETRQNEKQWLDHKKELKIEQHEPHY